VDSGLILSIAYTAKYHGAYRIISARKAEADASERRKYAGLPARFDD
jgi:uncharacterized DUF497 family protein